MNLYTNGNYFFVEARFIAETLFNYKIKERSWTTKLKSKLNTHINSFKKELDITETCIGVPFTLQKSNDKNDKRYYLCITILMRLLEKECNLAKNPEDNRKFMKELLAQLLKIQCSPALFQVARANEIQTYEE